MNVISAVANLQKERDWYKSQYEDAQGIIKQLAEGPSGDFEYIHPLDVCELISSVTLIADKPVNVYKSGELLEFPATGKKYKQSVLIPSKTKLFS